MTPTRLGVLGWPVAHSRSPVMQRAALRALGLRDWHYQLLPAPPEVFEEIVRGLGAAGFRGANVTIPHKEAALAVADLASPRATAIGAANTLTFHDDGAIHADNTDAPGLLAALPQSPRGQSALVLGAGGSARAVVWALREAGADVTVWNRTAARADALAERDGRAQRRPIGRSGAARELHVGGAGQSVHHVQGATTGTRIPGQIRDRGGPRLPGRRDRAPSGGDPEGLHGRRRTGGARSPRCTEPRGLDGPPGTRRRDAGCGAQRRGADSR